MENKELIIQLHPSDDSDLEILINWLSETINITPDKVKDMVNEALLNYDKHACINTNFNELLTYCDVSFYEEEGYTIVPIRKMINDKIIPEYIKGQAKYLRENRDDIFD